MTFKLDKILEQLTPAGRREVRESLRIGAPNTDVAELLSRHGHPISEASVRRWKADRDPR